MLDPKNANYVLAVDRSGSMLEPVSGANPQSRWDYANEFATGLARAVAPYDPDGICVVFFNASTVVRDGITADKAVSLFKEFSPGGGTETAGMLAEQFATHLKKKKDGETKSTILIVLTDGQPTPPGQGEQAVRQVIAGFTQKIANADEFSIQFFQVGDDAKATKFLKDLDENIPGAKFDIVRSTAVDEINRFANIDAMIAKITEH